MRFRIKEARNAIDLTQEELAEKLGIRGATLSGYETGAHDPKSEYLVQIANICGVSTDYLLYNDLYSKERAFSDEALGVAGDYDGLDRPGKKAVRAVLDVEVERVESQKQENAPTVTYIRLPFFDMPAAAGNPEWFDNANPEPVDYDEATVPPGASFAVGISGHSMEPDYPDGCTVFVRRAQRVHNGDIIIAWLDGEGTVCKRVVAPDGHVVRLESINRDFPDFSGKQLAGMRVYGRVIGKTDH